VRPENAASSEAYEWQRRFQHAVPAERLHLLRDLVRVTVMRVMRLDDSSPPARHDRLMDLGMDSLMALQLCSGLNEALGLRQSLPSTLMFDYPTIDAIAGYLLERTSAAAPVPAATNGARTAQQLDEAAVAAMSDDDIVRVLDQRLGMP
jgi:acyl carrier protein